MDDNVKIPMKLATDLLRYLGKQPCAGVVGMYAELAAIVVRSERAPAVQPAPAASAGEPEKKE